MAGGVADPGQVLHLVDDVDAVGSGPHAVVGDDLPEVDGDHPQRQEPEHAEHGELEAVERPPSPGRSERREALAEGRPGAVADVELYAHPAGDINSALIIA